MKKILLILFLIPLLSFSQLYGDNSKIGIINDSDGYTFIRENKTINSKVIDSLFKADIFLFKESDNIKWCKINFVGYAHKSRVIDLKKTPINKQRSFIDSIFDIEKKLHKNYLKETKVNQNKASVFHEFKFNPTLEIYINYSKYIFDEELFKTFVEIMISNSGSADETPPTALGYIFESHPQKVCEILSQYKSKIVNANLEFGFENVTYKRENEIQNLDELRELIRNLD